jgi:hypothetical protein
MPVGYHIYRHIQPGLFSGHSRLAPGRSQHAFVATPAKALLDLVYRRPQGANPAYVESLRP